MLKRFLNWLRSHFSREAPASDRWELLPFSFTADWFAPCTVRDFRYPKPEELGRFTAYKFGSRSLLLDERQGFVIEDESCL